MNNLARIAVILGLFSSQLTGGPGAGQVLAAAGMTLDNGASGTGDLPSAPFFAEKDIYDKDTIALENYRGKVVVLNFWATWCPPCRAEIPDLETLQGSHNGQVAVIGVSVYCSEFDTEQFYRDYRINYPMFYGSFELMEKYGKVGTIPTTFLINKKGRIAATVVGSRTRQQYEEMLKPLLDQ